MQRGVALDSFNWVKGDDNTRAKIAEHINKFYAMFPIADHVAEIVLRNGGIINLELPASCYYWKTGLTQRSDIVPSVTGYLRNGDIW